MKAGSERTGAYFYAVWVLYISAFSVIWCTTLSSKSPFSTFYKAVEIAVLLMLALGLLFSRITVDMALFLIVCAAAGIACRNRDFLMMVLWMAAARKLDFKRFIRVDAAVRCVCLIVIMAGFAFGLIPNRSGVFYHTYKESWGFRHPNVFAAYACVLLMELLMIAGRRLRGLEFILVVLAAAGVYKVTSSKTAVACLALFIFLIFLFRTAPRIMRSRPAALAFASVPPLMVSLGYLVTKIYIWKAPGARTIDRMLSRRPFLQSLFLRRYPVKLFGQNISAYQEKRVLDSALMRLLIQDGLIFTIIITAAYSLLIWHNIRQGEAMYAALAVCFVIYGFMEAHFLRAGINISLLLLLDARIWPAADFKLRLPVRHAAARPPGENA